MKNLINFKKWLYLKKTIAHQKNESIASENILFMENKLDNNELNGSYYGNPFPFDCHIVDNKEMGWKECG